MLKKFVSGIVGAALTFSMLGVAASELSVTSTSTHKGDGGGIEVTTVVTGVNTNDTITLMAHKGELSGVSSENADSTIVYIDQYDSIQDNGTLTRTYTIKGEDATGVRVSVGGRSGSTQQGLTASRDNEVTPAVEKVKVTVKVDEDPTGTLYSIDKPKPDEFVEIKGLELSKVVASVAIEGGDGDAAGFSEFDWMQNGKELKVNGEYLQKDVTLKVTSNQELQQTTDIETGGMGCILQDKDASQDSSVLGQGKITGLASGDMDKMEYGIAFASKAEDLKDGGSNAKKYPALGYGSDGLYAVKLEGISNFTELQKDEEGYLYCCAYIKAGNEYKCGAIYKVQMDKGKSVNNVVRGVPVVEVPGPAMDEVAVDVGPSAE